MSRKPIQQNEALSDFRCNLLILYTFDQPVTKHPVSCPGTLSVFRCQKTFGPWHLYPIRPTSPPNPLIPLMFNSSNPPVSKPLRSVYPGSSTQSEPRGALGSPRWAIPIPWACFGHGPVVPRRAALRLGLGLKEEVGLSGLSIVKHDQHDPNCVNVGFNRVEGHSELASSCVRTAGKQKTVFWRGLHS